MPAVALRGRRPASVATTPSSTTSSTCPSQVRAVLSGEGWTTEPPAGSGAVRERWESLAALVNLAQDFAAARPGATLSDLVAELDERANAQHAPDHVQGVTLASLHSAKGLEWDAVFLVGVAEGMMPISYAKTDEQIEEERRLLYVGVTRARERLHVSWALARSPGSRPNRRPSRFPDGLRPGSTGAAGRAGLGGPRRHRARLHEQRPLAVPRRTQRTVARCRVCRSHAHRRRRDETECAVRTAPPTMDEGLYERLREWREVQAQRSGQPAFCVFTDKTLMAIAETIPDDEGATRADPRRRSAQAQPLRGRCPGHLRRSGACGGCRGGLMKNSSEK
ncbi:3'-5' exonuclease [Streptomyces sp. L7]